MRTFPANCVLSTFGSEFRRRYSEAARRLPDINRGNRFASDEIVCLHTRGKSMIINAIIKRDDIIAPAIAKTRNQQL